MVTVQGMSASVAATEQITTFTSEAKPELTSIATSHPARPEDIVKKTDKSSPWKAVSFTKASPVLTYSLLK